MPLNLPNEWGVRNNWIEYKKGRYQLNAGVKCPRCNSDMVLVDETMTKQVLFVISVI